MALSPKKVTFGLVDTNKQTNKAKNDNSKQIPPSESSRKWGNQTEQIGAQPELKSILVPSSRGQPTQPNRYKRGLNAQFLRHNPRYIHEPVCHVLPNETSSSVGECLVWNQRRKEEREQKKITHSLDSTSRSDYHSLPGDQRPPPLSKHVTQAKICGIAPLTNEPASGLQSSSIKERISYRHHYNCRTEPNEPLRGKLHGSFVWKPVL